MLKNFCLILFLLTVMIGLSACTEENTSQKPSSEKPENQEVDSTDKDAEKDVQTVSEVVEMPNILTDMEIRDTMDKFEKINQMVIDTHRKLAFTEEEFYSPELQTEKLLKNLPDDIHTLVSDDMFNDQLPQLIQSMYEASGEGGFLPDINLDARMGIIENTPQKLTVKTFQLVEEIVYRSNCNVYITAIQENGQWVIDEFEATRVDEEPLHLTKEEFIKHEQLTQDSEIVFVGEEILTGATGSVGSRTANAYIVKIIKDDKFLARFIDTGEVLLDLPEKYK